MWWLMGSAPRCSLPECSRSCVGRFVRWRAPHTGTPPQTVADWCWSCRRRRRQSRRRRRWSHCPSLRKRTRRRNSCWRVRPRCSHHSEAALLITTYVSQ